MMTRKNLDFSEICFNLISSGNYDALSELLDLINQRLATGERRDEDQGLELCLPLSLAVEARGNCKQRRAELSADPISVLLQLATSTVPFYRQVAGTGSPANLVLDDFPLISRREIVAQYDHFLSERLVAERFKKFKATSGTTGTRLLVYFDLASFYDVSYSTYNLVAGSVPSLRSAIAPRGLAAIQVTN